MCASVEFLRSRPLMACVRVSRVHAQVRNGVAIVRPPGHHAERDAACGFCFFNTAALTARYAQSVTRNTLRVLILDWDVHHGNGTQHMFEDDDRWGRILIPYGDQSR